MRWLWKNKHPLEPIVWLLLLKGGIALLLFLVLFIFLYVSFFLSIFCYFYHYFYYFYYETPFTFATIYHVILYCLLNLFIPCLLNHETYATQLSRLLTMWWILLQYLCWLVYLSHSLTFAIHPFIRSFISFNLPLIPFLIQPSILPLIHYFTPPSIDPSIN